MDILQKSIDQENVELLIKILDQNGVEIFLQKMDNNNTILSYCVCKKQNIADLLLQYIMANVKCPIKRDQILNQVNNNRESLLYLSVKFNNIELSKKLYLSGVSDKHITKNGEKIKVNKNCNYDDKINFYYKKLSSKMIENKNLNSVDNMPKFYELPSVLNKNMNNTNYDIEEDTTELFLKNILCKSNEMKQNNEMVKNNFPTQLYTFNGGKASKKSSRNSKKLKKSSRNSKKLKKSSRSKFKKQSSEIHDKAVDEIMKLNYNIEDAKLIKAGLYMMVKDKYPDLNNYTRAEKMLEMVNKENIKKMDLVKLKKLIEKNKSEKNENKEKKEKNEEKK